MSIRSDFGTDQLYKVIHQIAASRTEASKLDLVALLESTRQATSVKTLTQTHSVTRPTVHARTDDLLEWGFLDRTDDGFRTTRSGHEAVRAYQRAATHLGDGTLAFITASSPRPALLRAVAGTATKQQLAADETLPTRKTIDRTARAFTERGLARRTANGEYQLTEAGRETLRTYSRLKTDLRQLLDKHELINQLAYWALPPLQTFEGTELVKKTEDQPYALLDATIEAAGLRTEGLSHLRSVTPIFDPALYDVFGQVLDDDTTFEIIYDQRTYQQLTQPRRLHYLAGAVLAPSVDVRIHPDPLYSGLGVYNDKTVMLAGSARHDQDFAVASNDDELRAWANERFEQLWAESEPPRERFTSWLNTIAPLRG